MSLDFDPSDDLANVADGVETVTLLRRGSTTGTAGTVIPHALRRAMSAGEAAMVTRGDVRKKNVPSGGQHTCAAVVWHLPVAELPLEPRLGDVILDAQNHRWTILAVKHTTLAARWRCETKDVATTNRYRIFVEEDLELDHTYCIRGTAGTIYSITAAIGAERIGELQVIEVQVVVSG